ncbi:Fic family protein [Georgenia wutianyii]|uniref:Fic family protein n=1 Tax=Georgenia wutianyii TaxID=2585135 RepID=A0ABX5VR10_9MICO|nr:Fic/DOC family N-terminal domain-containing protein [Georgenia wutianyii]QDB80503.1 Fic family protein [Georgenia wutianyii]
MDLGRFTKASPGTLVPITGTDPRHGAWEHRAFLPDPLPSECPPLTPATYLAVANARAALASLDSTARQLPNPQLLRRPTLQTEAQSTSALEGTYAPLSDVLTADEDNPGTADLREVLNYVKMADTAFDWLQQGRSLTTSMMSGLQRILVAGTPSDVAASGAIRNMQVVIGRRDGATPADLPVTVARFVPPPPGDDLHARVQDLLAWMSIDRSSEIDPVVAAAMAHYQFEALHPFNDGNGRIGRLLIVIHLLLSGVLAEPTLSVSPWFESRRYDYYDRLLAVSTAGDWDGFVSFFAHGLRESALATRDQMLALVAVQDQLKDVVRTSKLRADTAQTLVDYAVGHISFTVRAVQRDLQLSYGRANSLVGQLVDLEILAPLDPEGTYRRRFYAPKVLRTLVN